jgi:hypothetical protein
MSIHLSDEERASLEGRVNTPIKPTRRQKAIALLRLAEGLSPAKAAEHAGISKEVVEELAVNVAKVGLAGVGLGAKPKTLARLVRPGFRAKKFYLSNGATVGDLLHRSEATTTNHVVYVDGEIVEETAPLYNGAVVMIVPQTRNRAVDEPWRGKIRSFQDDALFQQYTETLKARREDLGPDEDATA